MHLNIVRSAIFNSCLYSVSIRNNSNECNQHLNIQSNNKLHVCDIRSVKTNLKSVGMDKADACFFNFYICIATFHDFSL